MPEILYMIQNSLPEFSLAGLFFLFFFGTFLSEDAACLLAGSMAANGRVGYAFAISACFAGIFVGDVLLYGVGRLAGGRVFENRFVRKAVSNRTLSKASKWLEENGASAVFFSRFVSGLRLPTYLLAGALKTNFAKFALYFLLASAIWTPLLVGATAFSQATLFSKSSLFGLIVLAITLRSIHKYTSWKNRRLLIGRIKRIAKWEFWPVQIFYMPIVLYVMWLATKHRDLTVFTAVNPSMPAGGFKGESKADIYRGLNSSTVARDHMLRFTVLRKEIATDEKLIRAWQFLDANSLEYPVVIKPNAGERGKDVRIVRSDDELESAILSAETDILLQEFSLGEEASIFYYRYPSQKHGRIFSITEKSFPSLIGDGVSTLEDLILRDARAVCLASKYFEQNTARLEEVPAKGEAVKLIDIGTHSRGAIFLDGGWMKTDALEKKIDDICRGYDGFYFGRFDIRTRSFEDLSKSEHFQIIELNGVTSESTNIYDPRYSLIDAYRILFKQWRIAFEIGAENVRLGQKASSLRELIRLTFDRQAVMPSSSACNNWTLTTDN